MSAETKYFYCRALLELGDVFRKRRMFDEALGYVHEARLLAFQESFLEFFRFWVLYTQCRIEKDRNHTDKLQTLIAELVPLADDPEKEAMCQELLSLSSTSSPERKDEASEAKVTRLDSIQPQR